ncbi:hypothetical protein TD95_005246 [Thielaviopsis punctulata]|uniref:Plasma membrane fusion protein PRM1 n=1 Tax=Thielaviopsis punctulata TaxID=72032 RepID=A0A0F4ZGD4_9PEZI|nr:hypothetical protein TD95_005246 [Thielaviopsis punctulata]
MALGFSSDSPAAAASDNFPNVPSNLQTRPVDISELSRISKAKLTHVPESNTPYLGLAARLSQTWLNQWTILLLLVLVKTLLTIGSLRDSIGDAKEQALAACTKVEDIGSSMASMPHYLSVGVNDMSASGIEKAVDGMVSAMQLAITVIESLILFVISMMTSTYVCLVTSMVHSGLDAATNVTKEVTDLMNDAISTVASSISDGATSLQDTINSFAQEIESSVFGKLLPDIPTVNFTAQISELKDIKVNTTSFTSKLETLNDKIPTFSDVKNLTGEVVSVPFDLIRNQLTQKYGNYVFDGSAFPVAQKQQLRFCSDNNSLNSFFDGLYKIVRDARTAFIVVLILLAVAAMAPMAWTEIRRWRRERENAKLVGLSKYDPMDVIYITSRPHSSIIGIKMASYFSGRNQILVRWAWAYMTSVPALLVLSLAMAGFFACLCQLIILHLLEKQVPELSAQVGDFAEDVVTTLQKSSSEWSNGANGVIANLNDEINNDLLGWVSNGTTAVNNTLNEFTDAMQSALDFAFNGTVLKEPIQDVIYCLIGLKVATVQKGLTWLHDQANVTFPMFPNNVFSLGANESLNKDSDLTTFLSSPSSVTTDEISGAVDKVITRLRSALVIQTFISLGVFLIYVVVVLCAMVRALIGAATPQKTRAEGGGSFKFTEDPPTYTPSPVYSAAPAAAVQNPFTNAAHSLYTASGEDDSMHMANFYPGATAHSTSEKVSQVPSHTTAAQTGQVSANHVSLHAKILHSNTSGQT